MPEGRDRLVALKKAEAETKRRVRRPPRELKRRGDQVVAHGPRGLSSNRKIGAGTEREAVTILSLPVYRGFGPTLATEYLAAMDDEAKLRRGRSRVGELVQWDTSDHDWLEGDVGRRYRRSI